MNRYLKFLSAALFVAMSASLISCGGDDDNDEPQNPSLWRGELADPRYEADAAAYEIINSPLFKSIELTSSGNYIVIPATTAGYASATRRSILRADRQKTSRAYNGGPLFGTYTKNGDGIYNLEGFGTFNIWLNDEIKLKLENVEYILQVSRLTNIESNALNNRLCRTWYLTKAVENLLDSHGNVLDTDVITGANLQEEYVKYIVITKAGTFLQVDWDNTFDGYGKWGWTNTSEQTGWYMFDDEDYTGSMQVLFDNDTATFVETMGPEYYEGYGNVYFQTVMTCRAI